MNYQSGLHILAELKSERTDLLSASDSLRIHFDEMIRHHDLNKLGEVYHEFPGGGFTGVVCLTESHIAIHTWPEFGFVTFDVFLSNYSKNNDAAGRSIYLSTLSFLEATVDNMTEIRR